MSAPILVGVGALVVLALAIGIAAMRSGGTSAKPAVAAVRAAPGLELAPPGAKLLDRFEGNPQSGGKASYSIAYGSDLDADAIGSFYDSQLPPLGWTYETGPLPADRNGDVLVRGYTRDGLRYTATLARLPRKVGTRWTTGPWAHILYVEVVETS